MYHSCRIRGRHSKNIGDGDAVFLRRPAQVNLELVVSALMKGRLMGKTVHHEWCVIHYIRTS